MRLAVAAIAAMLGAAVPAAATEWMYCADGTNEAGIDLLLGGADTVYLDSFILRHDDQVWASNTAVGPGDPVTPGQRFGDADHLDADFLDGDGDLLAQLRLRYAREGEMSVAGGTLRIVGRGAWAVACSGE